jgi:hypothetical protein
LGGKGGLDLNILLNQLLELGEFSLTFKHLPVKWRGELLKPAEINAELICIKP